MMSESRKKVEQKRKVKAFLTAMAGAGVVGGVVLIISNRKKRDSSESGDMVNHIKLLPKSAKPKLIGKGKDALANSSNLPSVFNSGQIAEDLYKYARDKNISGVLFVLKQISNVAQYSAVSEEFKKVTDKYTLVRYTIVTGLLDKFFSDSSSAKEQIKTELTRIGLKQDNGSGKWSLSGFSLHRDIITIAPTYVKDWMGNRILVNEKTILGDEKSVINGISWFVGIDGKAYQVAARDVKYL